MWVRQVKFQRLEERERSQLSSSERLVFDIVATAIMVGFVLFAGWVYFFLLNPTLGEERAAAIFVIVVLLPLFLIGHLLANLIVKRCLLPRYLSKRDAR